MMNSRLEYTSCSKKKERKKIVRSFVWNSVATVCFWSAYLSIFNLQSSINVEDGLGRSCIYKYVYCVGLYISAYLARLLKTWLFNE